MKEWFNQLEKREQTILVVGFIVVVFYLVYGVFYTGLTTDRDKYIKRNAADIKTLGWMNEAVQTIKTSRGVSGAAGSARLRNKSLSQLSELGAKRADIRIGRFQPKGEAEAQVWFDDVEFDKLIDYMARLELDYSLYIEDISVNSANAPGMVNARLKFSK